MVQKQNSMDPGLGIERARAALLWPRAGGKLTAARFRMAALWVVAGWWLVSMAGPETAWADGKFLRGEKWQKFTMGDRRADFYVAVNGNDQWSGTLDSPNREGTDGPFATIARAQEAVRALKRRVFQPKKPPVERRWIGSAHLLGEGRDILVCLRGGFHALSEPLRFGPEDGGERCETDLPSGAFEFHALKDHYVTYTAYPGETPIVSGARQVCHWRQEGGKWVAQAPGMEVAGLLANGVSQTLARTPNQGYFTPEEVPNSQTAFKFRPGNLADWPDLQGNRIIMLLRWHTGRNSIAQVDLEKRIVRLKEPQEGLVVVPPRYYVENLEALLDAPGEWHHAPGSGRLSFIPPLDLGDPNQACISVPRLANLVRVAGTAEKPVRNLRFCGLTFEGTTSGGSALAFEYAHACEVVTSQLRSLAGEGIHLDKGCYQTRILENTICRTEASGILVAGVAHPEKWMDSVRETVISRNTLSFCDGIAIADHNSLFSTISHNAITRNTGRMAISVGGWSNLEEAISGGYRVEYNHLWQVQERADDSGAITTSGMTYDSLVRGNLIHHVKGGYFNDNVAIWFDNMSAGWTVTNNIYYALDQGDMKLCAANLVDNIYRDNFVIPAPAIAPESIIEGEPVFSVGEVEIRPEAGGGGESLQAGQYLLASASLTNHGSSGVRTVNLFVDGRLADSRKVAAIRGNPAAVQFRVRFATPGRRQLAIEDSPARTIEIRGEPQTILYDDLRLSETTVPAGETITASARLENLAAQAEIREVSLSLDGKAVQTKPVALAPRETRTVEFCFTPEVGRHRVGIAPLPEAPLAVYRQRPVDLATAALQTYISAKAHPGEFQIDQAHNRFAIRVSGTDLMHAEDSYGTVYLKKACRGNFVATVKVARFGDRTHEWFRAGLLVRNDLARSFDAGPGSLGSVFCFATPGRTGLEWDEFGDGCMHKAASQNHPRTHPYPLWLKLVRQGDCFSSGISYDGVTWTNLRHTGKVPGIAESVDIGLAAGACDQRAYTVEFQDWTIQAEAP